MPNGLHDELGWASWMRPGGSERDFTPVGMAAPLAPLREQLVVLDGIDLVDDGPPADTHAAGQLMLLTAASRGRMGRSGGPPISVDQHLARQLGQRLTPEWPSLELAVQPDDGGMGALSYQADGTAVPPMSDPAGAYARVFAPFGASTETLLLRRSALDLVVADLAALRRRVAASDRTRLDAALDAVRTVERRLSPRDRAVCPAVPPVAPLAVDDPAAFRTVARAQLDLLVAALACDRTRIASVLFRGARGGLPCLFDPVRRPETLHALSHERKDDFVRAKAVHFEEIAYFVARLASIPEAGGTMLDHTLVFCATEVAAGHVHGRMPFATIGGRALGVQTGRYVRLPPGTPHARLLAALLSAMGLPDDRFGETGADRSPLPALFG